MYVNEINVLLLEHILLLPIIKTVHGIWPILIMTYVALKTKSVFERVNV